MVGAEKLPDLQEFLGLEGAEDRGTQRAAEEMQRKAQIMHFYLKGLEHDRKHREALG